MTKTLDPHESPNERSVDNGRRSFFFKLGAGVSTALASTAAIAAPGGADDPALRLALLEEERALRKLHEAFERALDGGAYDEVVEMFAEDAEVVFNNGVFAHRSRGISRLYRERFRAGKTGRRIEPAPGFELDAERRQDRVVVSADRQSAEAVFPYSIQVGTPIETETSLADMARLHGDGVRTWWEGGVYRVSYRKDAVDGRWRIARLEYDTLARADYRPGRTYALPITVAPISTTYPQDPQGADALVRNV
ncbi:MAG TPA: nuclear transport factor 2 family protein [Gammaproteobacteria bacterium]